MMNHPHPPAPSVVPRRSRATMWSRRAAAMLVASCLVLAGCATGNDDLAEQARAGDNKNYIAGDGSVAEYAPEERSEPLDVQGTLFDGTPVTSGDWAGAREGQRMRIEPCREDGKLGDEEGSVPYTAPVGDDDRLEHYFILPDEFWHEELFAKLTLSGVVMLLIIAKETSQKQDAWLALNRMSAWYGVSQPSAQEGIKQLRDLGYLEARDRWVLAPLAPLGSTNRIYYELSHEFSHEARKLRQTKTRLSREVRLRSVSKRNR